MSDLVFGLGISGMGMGLVFGLLALLWGVLSLIGRVDSRLVAREEALAAASRPAPADAAAPAEAAPEVEPELLAAIALAVGDYATLLRRQAAPAHRTTQPGSQLYASRWLAAGRTRQTRSFSPRR